jgi:hypothetical protein
VLGAAGVPDLIQPCRLGGAKDVRPYPNIVACRYNEAMQRWEYTTFDIKKPKKDTAEGLARLGADGWEAVAMVSSWGIGWTMVHPIVLLKRPVAEDA